MPRKTFSDIAGEVRKNAEPERPAGACFAWGCPLPGTMLGAERRCYIHDAHGHMDVQALTRAIGARRSLFDAVHTLYHDIDQVVWWTEIPGRYARPFREAGREDLLPTEQERKGSRQRWLMRARGDLEAEVLADVGIQTRQRAERKADAERRTYAPTDDDVAAANAAEQEIAARGARAEEAA